MDEGSPFRFGFKKDEYIIDVIRSAIWAHSSYNNINFLEIPSTLKQALANWDTNYAKLKELDAVLPDMNIHSHNSGGKPIAILENEVQLLPPIPNPSAFRDFSAFEQHARASRKQQGLDMHPDWFRFPNFYFSNPNALYGHGSEIPYPNNTNELDFELEFAIIISNGGSNIQKEDAHQYIAGYTICNDWSARDLQREEMELGLGPAKGKDFATSFGPYMVTPDELSNESNENEKLHLAMTCHINDQLISEGNTNDLYHSFPSMIERASLNANLIPGDYLGSGAVGTGCIMELDPKNTGGWLKKGDVVRLEIEKLGILENKIKLDKSE